MDHQLRKWLSRLGAVELRILFPVLIVVGGAWCFIALANEVREGETQRFDEWVLQALRRAGDRAVPVGPSELLGAARDLTALGGTTVLVVLICMVSCYLAIERKYRTMALVLIASVTGLAVSTLLKFAIQRERPSVVPHLASVSSPSFPSGHSALSALIYLTLGTLLARTSGRRAAKVFCIAVALVLALLVGVSRVYLGVHYPTDVLAGWTLGLVWALICLLAAQYLQRRGVVEQPGVASS